jgi:vacuolar-type H+-ATPase subunit H
MASGSDHLTSPAEDNLDTLPRTEVDIETELDALRDFVVKGGPTPLHHRIWLDLDEFEARLEHIVALLPKEVRRARRVCREEQRIIQDAKDEARRLLDEARAEAEHIASAARAEAEDTVSAAQEEAGRLVESSAIRQRALEQAETTLAQAQATAGEIRANSYAYAQQVVGNVVDSLRRLTTTLEHDRAQLEQNPPDSGS